MKDHESNDKKAFSEFLHKASDVSQKIAKDAYETTKETAKKIKETSDARKKEKLDPITRDEYNSEAFHIPNVIKIVDDALRRGVKFCEEAIAWREIENKTEILFLYDEAKDLCDLEFVPCFQCNAVYCVDPFDRHRFIRSDCIFSKAQEERLAELEQIAYCLGAKRCSVELVASETESTTKKQSINTILNVTGKAASSAINIDAEQSSGNHSSGKTVVTFSGHDHPTRPNLKWFSYDDTIKNLIEMRCSAPDSIKQRSLMLSGSSSAAMTQQTAVAIDVLLKKAKANLGCSMESQATKELTSKLIFEVEF